MNIYNIIIIFMFLNVIINIRDKRSKTYHVRERIDER